MFHRQKSLSTISGVVCALVSTLILSSCSLPTNPTPARWSSSAVIPLAKESVLFWEPLDSIVNDLKSGESGSTTLLRDSILTIVRNDTLNASLDVEQFFQVEPAYESGNIGEVILNDFVPINVPLVPQSITDNGRIAVITVPVFANSFDDIHFATTTKPVTLTITNSAPVTLQSGSIALNTGSENRTAAIPAILPGQSTAIQLPVENFSLISKSSTISVTTLYDSPITQGSLGSLEILLNGTTIDRGTVASSLFPDTVIIPVSIDIAESLLVKKISYSSLTLQNTVVNGFQFPVNLDGMIPALGTVPSTSIFKTTTAIRPGTSTLNNNLTKTVLTPRWNADSQKTVLDLEVLVMPEPEKAMITFDAKDTLSLTVLFGNKVIETVEGAFVNPLSDSVETDEWELPELLAPEMRDSVVGKLLLKNSRLSAIVHPQFSPLTVIDSLSFDLTTKYRSIGVAPKLQEQSYNFVQFKGSEEEQIITSADSVINSLPEKLATKSVIAIPKNTPFILAPQNGVLALPVDIYAEMKIPLHVVTEAPVSIISSLQEIEIPSEDMQILSSYESPQITLKMIYTNNSTMAMNLYGIGAGGADISYLESLHGNNINPDSLKADTHLFPITEGRFLPLASGQSAEVSWSIGSDAIASFIANNIIGIRFHAKLPGNSSMNLLDSSSIDVRTSIKISGILRSDFLKESTK